MLDDLHRAEGETLQLLRAVVTGLAGKPVLVVATLRGAEIGPDLEAALAALADPIADRIGLAGLGRDASSRCWSRQGVARPVARDVAAGRRAHRRATRCSCASWPG